ncbi:inositol monophosphatase family protein [Mycobacterium deserti]|uniref:Inositol-1-monophosphatase n=1 Tax=Mycobacterium deserti TaxID=2978347 RepID=A0ABT2M7Y4_9MYCO|nr:inositol monophosphatase family protein [Mycobacterium deserti]MCT7657520.1 inositol monophosphatase [Mycobacterium deserti]
MTIDGRDLLAVARLAADAGARVAMGWRERSESLAIEEKTGPRDLVSHADRDAEQAIRAVLSAYRPDDAVLGEEGGTQTGTSDVLWAVDPIDGTTNYLYGRPDWAVSVAAVRRSDRQIVAGVVVEPMLDRTTVASAGRGTFAGDRRMAVEGGRPLHEALVEVNLGREDQRPHSGPMISALAPRVRDVRRGGSAACALAQVATGRADAVWAPGLQPWDCAAGALLVAEAGGIVGDLAGRTPGTWPPTGDVLAAGPQLWDAIRDLLRPVYAEGV